MLNVYARWILPSFSHWHFYVQHTQSSWLWGADHPHDNVLESAGVVVWLCVVFELSTVYHYAFLGAFFIFCVQTVQRVLRLHSVKHLTSYLPMNTSWTVFCCVACSHYPGHKWVLLWPLVWRIDKLWYSSLCEGAVLYSPPCGPTAWGSRVASCTLIFGGGYLGLCKASVFMPWWKYLSDYSSFSKCLWPLG